MYRAVQWTAALAASFLVAGAPMLQPQWVKVARAASNRIQHMSQKSSGGGYDVATVILEAPSTRVYDRAITSLHARSDITIIKNDSKKGKIQFEKGQQVVGLQITALSDKLTQLVVASNVSDTSHTSGTSLVVDAIVHICEEVNVQCSVQGD
jgi:hypothetical protein